MRIIRALYQLDTVAATLPGHARWNKEVHVNAFVIAEIQTDAVIGRDLRKSSRAAVPLVGVIDLRSVLVVIGVVEAVPIFRDRLGAENAVVEHAFHAVAVAAIFGGSQQIARDLEMRIGAAWCLKARVRFGQALADFAAA